MRYISRIVAALMILASVPAANALPVSYTPQSADQSATVACHLPCPSIGPVLLHQGSARIDGSLIDVAAIPEWLFDPQIVLSGVVIGAQLDSSGPKAYINGLAYFNKGDWLSNLGPVTAKDLIMTTDGQAFTAQVAGIADNTFDCLTSDGTRRKVQFGEIKDIRSPRAYHFSIPAGALKLPTTGGTIEGEASRLTFNTGGSPLRGRLAQKPVAPKSNLPGLEGAVSNKAIVGWLALDVANDLAPIITAPIMYTAPFNRQRQLLKQFGNFSITGNPFNGVPTQSQLDAIFNPAATMVAPTIGVGGH